VTTATDSPPVEFTELTHDEIDAVLGRNKVGRLAFAFHDRVDIQPIHYAYERGWLYGRTSPGEKIGTLRHNQWVAFEVDEVNDVFEWRSVVLHGSFWLLRPHGTAHSVDVWKRAIMLLNRIVPGTFTEGDPVAFRQLVFRIAVADVRGRCANRARRSRAQPIGEKR
jgi:Predicted flavin-nucleotide-binding protein